MQRPLAVLDAPSNLGLRPPAEGRFPGCYKAPWALREEGLLDRLDAADAGVVVPPAYDATWAPGDGARNAEAIAAYTVALATRVGDLLDGGAFPVVLGGDCSILLGDMLALRRRGRYGLAFLDGHSDFRHPGNAEAIGAAAGEDLAIVTGRGDARLIDPEGLGPLVRTEDVAVAGLRRDDPAAPELLEHDIETLFADEILARGAPATAAAMLARLERPGLAGFWVHLDVDILDPELMPAVDSPAPGGIDHDALSGLLAVLLGSPRCAGFEVTIFDPDLDADGGLAARLVDTLAGAVRRGLR